MNRHLDDISLNAIENALREAILQTSFTTSTNTPPIDIHPIYTRRNRHLHHRYPATISDRFANIHSNNPNRFANSHSNTTFAQPTRDPFMDDFHSENISVLYTLREIISDYSSNFRQYTSLVQSSLHIIENMFSHPRRTVVPDESLFQEREFRSHHNRATPTRLNTFPNITANLDNQTHPITHRNPFARNRRSPLHRVVFSNVFPNEITRNTEIDISQAIRMIPFEENNPTILESRCPITLENFQEGEMIGQMIHCGHVFRENAIRNWLRRNSHCPVCRHDIRYPPVDPSLNLQRTDAVAAAAAATENTNINDEIDQFLISVSAGFSDMFRSEPNYDNSMNIVLNFPFVYLDIPVSTNANTNTTDEIPSVD